MKGGLIQMVGNLVGGFILVPVQRGLTPPQVVTAALQHFGIDIEDAEAYFWSEEEKDLLYVPATEAIQTSRGTISSRVGSLEIVVHMVSVIDGYIACMVGTHDGELFQAPEEKELFVERWIELCEDVQAEYAYFGSLEDMVEDWHLYEVELPALQQRDVVKLFYDGDHWFSYFGRDLVSLLVNESQVSFDWGCQELPSGGLFVYR
jgi:hypothetical protein